MTPTPEQRRAVAAFAAGETFRLRAVAGSGKTTTLRLMAEAAPQKHLLYVAFNRTVAKAAGAKFPRNTEVRTLHSMAHRQVVRGGFRAKLQAGEGTIPPRAIMAALDVDPLVATALRAMLERFLRSDDPLPEAGHIPAEFREAWIRRTGRARWRETAEELVRLARLVWKRMQDPDDPFPISHDAYVRLWRDGGGRIEGVDAVLVDEAQDLDPVFRGVLERSQAQRVYVGDPLQQIYAWRGAVNAMQELSGPEHPLTRSFRFAEPIAAYVRRVTAALLGQAVPLVGAASWDSEVVLEGEEAGNAWPRPLAILARTNAGVIDAAVACGTKGLGFHVAGGLQNLLWLLRDAAALAQGRRRSRPHPELAVVETWDDLERLAEEARYPAAAALLRLFERYRDLGLLAEYLERSSLEREAGAPVVLSTVHKAKGREWDHVMLWDDFQLGSEGGVDAEEANILYVALTRARRWLHAGRVHGMVLGLEERRQAQADYERIKQRVRARKAGA